MNQLIILIIAGLLVALLFLLAYGLRGQRRLPYYKKNYLLTKAEASFFRVLQLVLYDDYHIFPQISLKSIVGVKSDTGKYYSFWNRINQKTLDFVLFSKNGISPLLVIELDDSSHLLAERNNRDTFLDQVLEEAGIRILHIKTQQSYNPQELINLLKDKGISISTH